MAKDYSKLKNIKNIEWDINEKEIETKYSEFLDWLVDDINKKELTNDYINTNITDNRNIPLIFTDILFTKRSDQKFYDINKEIEKYLINLKIRIVGDYSKTIPYYISCIRYVFTCDPYNYHIHKNILKIPQLEKEISELKQTNQDILKKLEEQIQLNSKLCERIFEMKEEKFKDEKS